MCSQRVGILPETPARPPSRRGTGSAACTSSRPAAGRRRRTACRRSSACEMPSRAAASRSIVKRDLQAAVLLIGVDVDQSRAACASRAAACGPHSIQVVRGCRRAACTDTARCSPGRRCADPARPARTSVRAGNLAQFCRESGRSPASARQLALFERLERDEHAGRVGAPPPPCPPVKAITPSSTAGSSLDDVGKADQQLAHRLETTCPDRPGSMPIRRPVSCCGKNPLGTMTYR